MDLIPTPKKCVELLIETGCSDLVINHCKKVKEVAVNIAKKTDANIKLVEVGALLHDIGRSKTNGIRHAVEGANIAKNYGLPQSIIKIIERHIGAGISLEVAKKLDLPPKDYTPQTLEEKIVCHADNLVNNNRKQNIQDEIKKAQNKGQKEYAERLLILHNQLSKICGMDLNQI